jgi:hypothetical protein
MSCLDLTAFLPTLKMKKKKEEDLKKVVCAPAKSPLDYGKNPQNSIHQTLENFHLAH